MKQFKDLHPAIQLSKLVFWAFDFIEGGNESAMNAFNKHVKEVSNDIFTYADAIDADISLIPDILTYFPKAARLNAVLCPKLISACEKRINHLRHLFGNENDAVNKEIASLESVVQISRATI